MNYLTWLDDVVCERLMLTFAHFLWQGLIVGFLAALLAGLMRRLSAQSRYLLFTASLLAMVACLPLTYGWLQSNATPENVESVEDLNMLLSALPEQSVGNAQEIVLETVPDEISTDSSIVAMPGNAWDSFNQPMVVRGLTCFYLAGVLLLLGRFGLGVCGALRLRKTAGQVEDAKFLEMISTQARKLELRTIPSVLLCEQILIPVVTGFLRPAILVPVALMSGLTPREVEDIITHELAHIRRHDYIVNFLQRMVEAFLFFHPAVWFVSRRIRIEREHCCDDLVVGLGAAPLDYATALLNVVEIGSGVRKSESFRQLALLKAAGSRADLRRRIERLVNRNRQPQIYLTRKGIMMTSLATTIILAGSMLFSATFPVEDERDDQNATPTATQSDDGAEPDETVDVSRLPEIASKNGSLDNGLDSNEITLPDESTVPASEDVSVHKLREQPEAKNLTLVSIVQIDGRSEAWLLRNSDQKKFALRKGDSIEIGKTRMTITLLDKTGIKVAAGGEQLQVALGKTLKDAVPVPSRIKPAQKKSEPPKTKKGIILKDVDSESLVGVLREMFPDSNLQISFEPEIEGFIIKGRKEDVEGVQRITELIEKLDQNLKTERQIESLVRLLSRKRDTANTLKKIDSSTNRVVVFQLKWGKAEEIAKSLKDVLKRANASADHRVTVDQKKNGIIVYGTVADLKMVEAIVVLLDRKPGASTQSNNTSTKRPLPSRQKVNSSDANPLRKNQGPAGTPASNTSNNLKIFSVKHHDANELSNLVTDVFKDLEQRGYVGIAVDPRTNSIIITSETESNMTKIEDLLRAMDVPQQQQPGRNPAKGRTPMTPPLHQPGTPNVNTATKWPMASRQAGAGMPTDLIRLTEAYSNAARELRLAEVENSNATRLAKKGLVPSLEIDKSKLNYEAAKLKIALLKQIAEAALNETQDEMAAIKEQLEEESNSQRAANSLKRKLAQQEFRVKIISNLISR